MRKIKTEILISGMTYSSVGFLFNKILQVCLLFIYMAQKCKTKSKQVFALSFYFYTVTFFLLCNNSA